MKMDRETKLPPMPYDVPEPARTEAYQFIGNWSPGDDKQANRFVTEFWHVIAAVRTHPALTHDTMREGRMKRAEQIAAQAVASIEGQNWTDDPLTDREKGVIGMAVDFAISTLSPQPQVTEEEIGEIIWQTFGRRHGGEYKHAKGTVAREVVDGTARAIIARLVGEKITEDQNWKACQHKISDRSPSHDAVQCEKCNAIRTDSLWKLAPNTWFENLEQARFYEKHGRLPDAIGGKK